MRDLRRFRNQKNRIRIPPGFLSEFMKVNTYPHPNRYGMQNVPDPQQDLGLLDGLISTHDE